MFDRPIIALKDEEEMEDFHDYDCLLYTSRCV